ncbi:MAG: diadenylate cyclase CdaA [Breznakibacter sp.]
MAFLDFRWIDLVDIFLVAFLMYKFYQMVKGTVAFNILVSLFVFVLFWFIIKSLKMDLSASILENVVNVGMLGLVIVFQQEIRQYLLHFGSKYKLFYAETDNRTKKWIEPTVRACENMAKAKTGALIVVTREAMLIDLIESGDRLHAEISTRLIESLFFKNNPLHDGAIVISNNKIEAAACILPVSQNQTLPKHMGLRHRAAMGIAESTDAVAIVVSEERGEISLFVKGTCQADISPSALELTLNKL